MPALLHRWVPLWQGLALLLLCGLGCVQWVDIEPTRFQNHAPRIMVEKNGIAPLDKAVLPLKQGSGATTFTITRVAEEDLTDKLYVYWFLDFHKSPSQAIRCQTPPNDPNPDPAKRQEIREVEFSCEITHQSLALGTSVLEVFVLDRPMRSSSTKREWDPEARWDYWCWVLQVEP